MTKNPENRDPDLRDDNDEPTVGSRFFELMRRVRKGQDEQD